LIAFFAALGEGFRDTYGQNVNDDPTVSGTPSQCVPDLYPGSEYIQQNPDAAGTVTIDRTGIVPALVFDDGIDFIASIATESGNYETFFPNGVSAVFLEETPTCCGGTTVTPHTYVFDPVASEFVFNSYPTMVLFSLAHPGLSDKIRYYPYDFIGPIQEDDVRLGPLDTCLNLNPKPVRQSGESETAYNQRFQQWKNDIRSCMNTHPPRESDGYVPPKGGPKKSKGGWVDKDGKIWKPWDPSQPGHSPHWDVQDPDGGYENVYLEPEIPEQGETLFD
jgi:hypothetical protein